jgi:hypothetical protein
MTAKRSGWARLLALASLLGVLEARADTWAPPEVRTIQSAHWSARATITPAITFEVRHRPRRDSASVRVERHMGHGQWREVWAGPLLNSTAPVDALVSDDGATLVTFDNHHSMGSGDDVVVIYDATGRVVRKRSLEQLLPAAWIEAIPHSVSSIWWRGDKSAIVEDGRTLLIDVVAPGQDHTEHPPRTVPLLVRLADGALLHAQRPEWKAALRELVPIVARKDQAWERHRALQAEPLFAPKARDLKSWRKVMVLARERLAHATDGSVGGWVLLGKLEPDECCDGADRIASALREHGKYRDTNHYLFVSPDGRKLAALLAKELPSLKPGALAGVTLWVAVTAVDFEAVRQAATRAGAKAERIDLEAGMAGVELPRPRPPGFTGEYY